MHKNTDRHLIQCKAAQSVKLDYRQETSTSLLVIQQTTTHWWVSQDIVEMSWDSIFPVLASYWFWGWLFWSWPRSSQSLSSLSLVSWSWDTRPRQLKTPEDWWDTSVATHSHFKLIRMQLFHHISHSDLWAWHFTQIMQKIMHISLCCIYSTDFSNHFILNLLVNNFIITQHLTKNQNIFLLLFPLNKKISQLEIISIKCRWIWFVSHKMTIFINLNYVA